MKVTATSVSEYLAALPPERREVVSRVRDVVLRNLPPGYTEALAFGMIGWGIPLEAYPDSYNGQPVGYAALASQKNYMTLYLMGAYADPDDRNRLEQAYAKKGKRLQQALADDLRVVGGDTGLGGPRGRRPSARCCSRATSSSATAGARKG